ncbi:MAG: TrmB family transcriptional regulator [Halobacteriota archaeon]
MAWRDKHTIMLLDMKTLDTLQKLGLSAYEAKAFTALVAAGPTTATMLSAESEIPRTKIYGVLKRLEEKQWITVSKGRPSTFTSRYPKEVIEQRRALFGAELDQCSNTLTLLYNRKIENEAVNALFVRGLDSISAKMMEMMDRARRSVTIMGSFLSTSEIAQLNLRVINAREKGVSVRIVIPPQKASDMIEAFLPVKDHVRLFVPPFAGLSPPFEGFSPFDDRVDSSPQFARQVIVDRREMLVAIVRTDEGIPNLDSAIAIWMSNASFAQYIADLTMFDRVWKASEQIN